MKREKNKIHRANPIAATHTHMSFSVGLFGQPSTYESSAAIGTKKGGVGQRKRRRRKFWVKRHPYAFTFLLLLLAGAGIGLYFWLTRDKVPNNAIPTIEAPTVSAATEIARLPSVAGTPTFLDTITYRVSDNQYGVPYQTIVPLEYNASGMALYACTTDSGSVQLVEVDSRSAVLPPVVHIGYRYAQSNPVGITNDTTNSTDFYSRLVYSASSFVLEPPVRLYGLQNDSTFRMTEIEFDPNYFGGTYLKINPDPPSAVTSSIFPETRDADRHVIGTNYTDASGPYLYTLVREEVTPDSGKYATYLYAQSTNSRLSASRAKLRLFDHALHAEMRTTDASATNTVCVSAMYHNRYVVYAVHYNGTFLEAPSVDEIPLQAVESVCSMSLSADGDMFVIVTDLYIRVFVRETSEEDSKFHFVRKTFVRWPATLDYLPQTCALHTAFAARQPVADSAAVEASSAHTAYLLVGTRESYALLIRIHTETGEIMDGAPQQIESDASLENTAGACVLYRTDTDRLHGCVSDTRGIAQWFSCIEPNVSIV